MTIRLILCSLSFALASSCGSSASQNNKENKVQESPVVAETAPQEVAQQTTETESKTVAKVQNSMLLGEIDKEAFLSPPFASWFNPGYDSFNPNPEAMKTIEENISKIDMARIYMGTWCSDSQREVPHFFKILEQVDYELDKVEMVAVDMNKAAPDNSHEEYSITHVPTFIFYKKGKEIGRFVEYPSESLEKDVAKILSGQEYKHSYDY